MRAFVPAIILVTVCAGCKEHSAPATHGIMRRSSTADDLHEIPPGRYDAIFSCSQVGDVRDLRKTSSASAYFWGDSGDRLRIPTGITVSVNGDTLTKTDIGIPVHFPTPLTWRLTGNDHYPSVVHTLASITPIEFLSPHWPDSIRLSDSVDVRYNAPNADTVLFHIVYFGKGVYKKRPTVTENTGQSYYYHVPNTGRYVIAPFEMYDGFKSFNPEHLMVQIMVGRGDTVHVGDYVYGFVTSCRCMRDFRLTH